MKRKIPRVLYATMASLLLAVLASFILSAGVLAASPVCTWTGAGGGGLWSNSGNWSCTSGTLPVNGDSVVFNVTGISSIVALTQDISNLQLDTITFTGSGNGFGGFTIGGSTTITLTGGIVTNTTGSPVDSINVGITLANDLTFTGSQDLNFSGGPITIGAHTLTFSGAGTFIFRAPIVGSGTLNNGATMLMQWDNPNFSGQLNIANSVILSTDTPNVLGSSTVTISNGGTMTIQADAAGTFTYSNAFHLGGVGNGSDSNAQIRLRNFAGGSPVTVNFAGPVTLSANTDAELNVVNANFTGPVTGCGFTISRLTGSTGTLGGNLIGSCTPSSSNSSSSDPTSTSSTPKAPATGYGEPADSSVSSLLFILGSICLALGTRLFYARRHDQ